MGAVASDGYCGLRILTIMTLLNHIFKMGLPDDTVRGSDQPKFSKRVCDFPFVKRAAFLEPNNGVIFSLDIKRVERMKKLTAGIVINPYQSTQHKKASRLDKTKAESSIAFSLGFSKKSKTASNN